jgi:RHS repeat-associated protein
MINDGIHSYTYDADNRITQVDAGSTATYSYDAWGQRLRKTTPALGAIDYVRNFSGDVLGEFQVSSGYTGWNRYYLYMGGKLVAEDRDATTYFRHEDHLGSASVLTTMSQGIHDAIEYQPYGEQASGATGTTHKFTGKERDVETNLDDFDARYYSSTMGRFMIPDWAGSPTAVPYARFGNPQSLNLYSYVENNPTTVGDPDGHDDGGGGGAAAATSSPDVGGSSVTWGPDSVTVTATAPTAQNKSWFQKALGYFYFKVGKGEGFGVKDVKIGPAKVDIGVWRNGKDFKQTTKGMQVTTVNSEAGAKVELGPIKLGVQRTNTQEEGQPAKVEWLPGFEFGKAEGTNSEVGIGGGGCFLVCGQRPDGQSARGR